VRRIVIDTGPLVSLLNKKDRYNSWIRGVLDTVEPPIFTCEPVLSEACFLLGRVAGGPDAVLALIAGDVLRVDFNIPPEVAPLRALMLKYASIPMALADACLVRMTELESDSVVVTFDSDFKIYRRNKRQAIPTLTPH
jgi:uncharacterized protein